MPLSVRASGFVMSESWFVLTVSALTELPLGRIELKSFFGGILDFV